MDPGGTRVGPGGTRWDPVGPGGGTRCEKMVGVDTVREKIGLVDPAETRVGPGGTRWDPVQEKWDQKDLAGTL